MVQIYLVAVYGALKHVRFSLISSDPPARQELLPDGGAEHPIILLFMRDGRDRELLEETLGASFQVVTTTDKDHLSSEFDCCIVDQPSFHQFKDVLQRRKESEKAFLPLVLLSSKDQEAQLRPTLWHHVDDVIDIPVNRGILLAQIENLTARRDVSKELARQNERLDGFASIVAHDLRNPLNVAQGRVGNALDDEDDEELERAKNALDRMEHLIEDLLLLAKSGRKIDELEAITLSEIVYRCWEVIEAGAVKLSIESDLQFYADPARLQQLLENLIRNAIEHGGEDITISIGILNGDDGFYIEDDGPGISDEVRENVFESGFTSGEDSTGFGLWIVQEIAGAHDWAIELKSSDSGGARFEIIGVELIE